LYLHVDITGAGRHRQGTQFLNPELKAHPGGPDAVADRDLHPVEGRDPGHLITAGEKIHPVVKILLGIGEDLALAGRPGTGMDTDDLLEGNRSQRKRVTIAQVVCRGHRQAFEVV